MPPQPRFASLDDFKNYLSINSTDQDDMLKSVLSGAEQAVERYCRRRFSPEPALAADGTDTLPPVAKKFTTRGRTVMRVPDLRKVDLAPDPMLPNSGGVQLYGRTLLANQFFLGYGGYATGGAYEPIGSGSTATPATEITLGYGYGTGYTIAGQFAYVLPLGYMANDLVITGRWGWNPTPPALLDALYTFAARRYRERDAAYSDTVVTPDGASLSYFRQMPASVKMELDSFREPNFALL